MAGKTYLELKLKGKQQKSKKSTHTEYNNKP